MFFCSFSISGLAFETVLLRAGPKFTRKNLVRSDFVKPFPAWGMFLKVLNFKSQYDSCFCFGETTKSTAAKNGCRHFFWRNVSFTLAADRFTLETLKATWRWRGKSKLWKFVEKKHCLAILCDLFGMVKT